ncbi:hypothetical protein QOT17_018068 [Balamuthia mandrillaris]
MEPGENYQPTDGPSLSSKDSSVAAIEESAHEQWKKGRKGQGKCTTVSTKSRPIKAFILDHDEQVAKHLIIYVIHNSTLSKQKSTNIIYLKPLFELHEACAFSTPLKTKKEHNTIHHTTVEGESLADYALICLLVESKDLWVGNDESFKVNSRTLQSHGNNVVLVGSSSHMFSIHLYHIGNDE